MNPKPRSLAPAALLLAGAFLIPALTGCKGDGDAAADGGAYEAQQKAEAAARAADPAWRPSAERTGLIKVAEAAKVPALHNFCLDADQRLLACCGGSEPSPKDPAAALAVFSAEGKFQEKWPLPSTPEAVCVDDKGVVYVGGAGRLHKLDRSGKVLASADSPIAKLNVPVDREALEKMTGNKLDDQEFARYRDMLQSRKGSITGIASTGTDLFVACPSLNDFTFTVYRMDLDFGNPKLVIKGLRGCCGQMDIQARDGKVWVAHNARHLVESYDREGKKLGGFGRNDRKAADGFGGCCEPKNLRLGSDGNVYAAESGPPVAIKRFNPAGTFGGVVAAPTYETGCVRTTLEVSKDCKRFYLLNSGVNGIEMFAAKK
jgi:sugar lactone lactonase YvrE